MCENIYCFFYVLFYFISFYSFIFVFFFAKNRFECKIQILCMLLTLIIMIINDEAFVWEHRLHRFGSRQSLSLFIKPVRLIPAGK